MQTELLFRHHELSRFIISFTDDDGNYINFNGISSFFTLQFDIYRRWIPKPPRFSNIIEYVNNYVGNQGFPTTHPFNNYFNNNEEEPVEDNI